MKYCGKTCDILYGSLGLLHTMSCRNMHGGGAELWGWSYSSGPSGKTGPETAGPDNCKTVSTMHDAKFILSDQHYMH
jgi:hypothetical protein